MKKKIRIIALLVIAVLLTGCTSLSTERKDENEQDITGYEEILDLMKAEGWRDNSLDAYYADVRCEIKYEVPDGADSSIGGQFIVASRNNVFIIRKWLYEDYKKNWDEKYTVDINGDLSKNRISRQVFCVGASTCANGYICEYIKNKDENRIYSIGVMDEEGLLAEEIDLKEETGLSLSRMMMDSNGLFHTINYNGNEYEYLVFDHDGYVLYRNAGNYINLYAMYDGNVGATKYYIEENTNAYCYDFVTFTEGNDVEEKIDSFKGDYKGVNRIICPRKGLIIYTDDLGIHQVADNVSSSTYLWIKHGIIDAYVYEMQSYEENQLKVIFHNNDINVCLFLKQTEDIREIKTIELVTSPESEYKYKESVSKFNNFYPEYQIDIVTGYDDIQLRTLLLSGKGPTIIDTDILGFSTNSELWMDLGPIWNSLGLDEELSDAAISLGTINGQLKGVVTEYSLETIITDGKEPINWTYKDFLDYSIRISDNRLSSSDDGYEDYSYVLAFLMRKMDDSYLFDSESCKTYFNDKNFESYVKKIKNTRDISVVDEDGMLLHNGEILFARASITRPEDYVLYQKKYKEDFSYSGYPSKTGGKHLLKPRITLAIQKNASAEECAIACKFFEIILSYDAQKACITDTKRCLSVRKDVLSEQVDIVCEETKASKWNIAETKLGSVAKNWDKDGFYALLNDAVPEQDDLKEISEIIKEELLYYFSNDISEEKLSKNLNSRVGLLLEERK